MSINYGEIKIDEIGNQNEYIEYHKKLNINSNLTRYNIYTYHINLYSRDEGSRYNIKSEYNSTIETPLNIILYDLDSSKIYFKSNNILSIKNKQKILEKLKENNTYIIHVVYNVTIEENKTYEIIFIDNCCNYYIFKTGSNNQDYFVYEYTNNFSKVNLTHSVIDSIKKIKTFNIYNMLTIIKEQNKYINEYEINHELYEPTFIYKSSKDETNVMIAGSFNNWKKYVMTYDSEKNTWNLYMKLKPGEYEYKFIINNEWVCDPSLPVNINNDGYCNHKITIKKNINFNI